MKKWFYLSINHNKLTLFLWVKLLCFVRIAYIKLHHATQSHNKKPPLKGGFDDFLANYSLAVT